MSACRNSAGFSVCILLSPSLGEGWGLKAVENAACCHRNGAFSQLLVAACNFQRWFEFLCSSFIIGKGISLVFCLPLLSLRLFDHSDIISTSVTQSQGWWKVLLCATVYWHCVFNGMLGRAELKRRGQDTSCHLRLSWTGASFW